MNKLEKQVDYVVNKITRKLPFGDKDNITKEYVYEVLNINSFDKDKIKEVNLILLNGLNEMVVEGNKLVNNRKYYSNESRTRFYKFKNNVESVIKNRKILNNITNEEDELIDTIKLNVETIYHYRNDICDILCEVKTIPKEFKFSSLISGIFRGLFSLLESLGNFTSNQEKKYKQEKVDYILKNAYLTPLEEKMLKNGEFDPSDFSDDEYQENEDYDN